MNVAAWRAWLPRGRRLDAVEFDPRHYGVVALALGQALALFLFGLYRDLGLSHSTVEAAIPAALALLALIVAIPQRVRSVLACTALVVESAILVHFSGGYIEAHFHFFAMLAVIALYQDYVPFLVAVGFVALDHGILGTIAPTAVYNHPSAIANPWGWAAIHAAFVAIESAALLVSWKVVEEADERRATALASLEMQQRLSAQREALHRNERLTSLGTLVAGVAHEINNPLTYISANVEMAIDESKREDADREEIQRMLATALAGTDRIAHITRALRTVARQPLSHEKRDSIELAQLVRDVQTLVAGSMPLNVEFAVDADIPAARVAGNPYELHQAVLNLVQNAIQAVEPNGGAVHIEARSDGERALLHVADNGPGIPEELRAKIFTPFFTTKAQGTGLGLSIVHTIVSQHGGSLHVESAPSRGARFTLALPLTDPR